MVAAWTLRAAASIDWGCSLDELGLQRALSHLACISGLNALTNCMMSGSGCEGWSPRRRSKRVYSATMGGSAHRCSLRRHMINVPVAVTPSRQCTYTGWRSGVTSRCRSSAARSCVSVTSSFLNGSSTTA
eukprot:scaffold121518_cov57-Phaeocystis_antarctica.AAC.1